MKGVYVKGYLKLREKDFYLVDRLSYEPPRNEFKVISKLSEKCVFNKGSRLSLIDVGTKFYPIGARDLFKEIF
jgi:hypothetical protein